MGAPKTPAPPKAPPRHAEFKEMHHLLLSVHCRTPRRIDDVADGLATVDWRPLLETGVLELQLATAGLRTLFERRGATAAPARPGAILAMKAGKPVKVKLFATEEQAAAFLKRAKRPAGVEFVAVEVA